MATQQTLSAQQRYLNTFNKPQNIVVMNEHWQMSDAKLIFSDIDGRFPQPVYYTKANNLESLLSELGYYGSKGEARRSGKQGPIKGGYSELEPCKPWNHMEFKLYIWNPTTPPPTEEGETR